MLLKRNEKLYPRKILPRILKYIQDDNLIVLIGPRQSGKTSVMLLLMDELLKMGTPEKCIFYLDLEDVTTLTYLEKGPAEFITFLKSQGLDNNVLNFIFIDEIQYLGNPTNFLKLIVDHHKYLKLIISGSSTLEIRQKFKDSLAGRKVVFEILPLDFEEFLIFKNENRFAELIQNFSLRNFIDRIDSSEHPFRFFMNDIQRYFQEFVIFGGYPRVALESEYEKKITYLTDIFNSYVRKDIKDLMRIDNVFAFNRLISMLALQIANLVNNSDLAVNLQLSRLTLERYLFLLENTFIVKLVPPFFSNKRKEIVKMKKLFFLDTGLRNIAVNNFDNLETRVDKGELVENFVFSNLYKNKPLLETIHFWRTKAGNEVDFILHQHTIIPIEVKYKPFAKPAIPPGLRSFTQQYPTQHNFVLTREYYNCTKFNNHEIMYLPVWLA